MSPNVTANLTIGVGNVVSGTIVIGPVAINNFSAGPGGRGEDSWTSATITLTPKAADSVVGNTLVIGSAGFPTYLQAADASDQFPSETARRQQCRRRPRTSCGGRHHRPSASRTSRGNTGTTGTMAVADVVGWTCNDVDGNIATGACGSSELVQGSRQLREHPAEDHEGRPPATRSPSRASSCRVAPGRTNPATAPNWVAWTFSAPPTPTGTGVPGHHRQLHAGVERRRQLDSNGDGYGNLCDGDLNNSNLTTSTDFNCCAAC